MSDKFSGFTPKHKVIIEKIQECHQCYVVDGIVVPHCDCVRHSGLVGAAAE